MCDSNRSLLMLRFAFFLWLACLPVVASAEPPAVGDKAFIKDGASGKTRNNEDTVVHERQPYWVTRIISDRYLVGEFWVQSKDVLSLDQAEEYYSQEIEQNPTANAWYSRALVWEEKREYDKGIQDCSEAIKLAPKDEQIYFKRGFFRYLQRGDLKETLKDFDEAIRLNPDEPNFYSWRAPTLRELGEYDKAIQDFNEVLKHNPEDTRALTGRASIWGAKGELDKAIDDYTEAIRIDPRNWFAYLDRGMDWQRKGDMDQALLDFSEVLRLNPEYQPALVLRGSTWINLDEHDKALKDLTLAIQIKPDHAAAYVYRGHARHLQKNYELALQDFTKAIRLNADYENAYVGRGITYNKTGKYELALQDFTKAIQLNPNDPRAYNNRAWLRASCLDAKYRNGALALKDAKKSCELTEWKHSISISTLAEAYAESGDFENAIKWQKEAIKLAPKEELEEKQERLKLYESGQPYREPVAE